MTTEFVKTPTNRELVAARDKQAVAQYSATYRNRYLDEVAPQSIAGRLIKFDKSGQFVTSDDGKPLPKDDEYIVLADETQIGWIKFNGDGEAPERHMGLLFDGFEMPTRESLGDLDPSKWEQGLDGQPSDPWLHQQNIVLQQKETSELFTFSTSSKTGRRAVGNLLRHYMRMAQSFPGQLPIVRLGKGGYEHKDARVGWVDVPVFVVTGRTSKDAAAKPGLNDALPF